MKNPERHAVDDFVFDALALTEAERKEVYWAVCELVKNRFQPEADPPPAEKKARNV